MFYRGIRGTDVYKIDPRCIRPVEFKKSFKSSKKVSKVPKVPKVKKSFKKFNKFKKSFESFKSSTTPVLDPVQCPHTPRFLSVPLCSSLFPP
jgi:hypothetical protein